MAKCHQCEKTGNDKSSTNHTDNLNHVSAFRVKPIAHQGRCPWRGSVEAADCEVLAGAYQLQFSSYQSGGFGQKYCERVPGPGQTSLFIDFNNRRLRTVPIAVEVIEGSQHGDGANTVLSVPAKVYAQGSIELDHAFKQPGEYVAIVRFGDGAEGFEARFPLTMGSGTVTAWWTCNVELGVFYNLIKEDIS